MNILKNDRAIIVTSIVGVLVSTYALYVEMSVEANPEYKALCDISERASCSRVLSSEYSKGFGLLPKGSPIVVPNCIYGIIFYCFIIFLTTYKDIAVVRVQLYLSLASVVTCIYLAYLLIFVLKDVCLVCITTYFVNGILTALIYKKWNYLTSKLESKNE